MDGGVAVSSLPDSTLTAVAALPIVTVAPATKPLPLIVTAVAPALGPEAGAIELTLGGVGRASGGAAVEVPLAAVTTTSKAPGAVGEGVAGSSLPGSTSNAVA